MRELSRRKAVTRSYALLLVNRSRIAAESSTTLPAPSARPPLSRAFWQSLLFGSRDSLIPAGDGTKAVRLTAEAIGKDSDMAGFTESVRVNTLRKILAECFGAAAAWQA
ncbi:MAG TPA: hypothetical protein VFO40_08440 [Chthoniobacterales bacterium]|nr:hypothetical protein [Chthoniobacterales bacterium]